MNATDIISAIAVGAGALAQAVTGIGFALVCAPFLIAAAGAREGVRTAVALSAVLNLAMLVREHRLVSVPNATTLLVPAALATPLLAWALRDASRDALTAAAGGLTVLSAAALLAGIRIRSGHGRPGAAVAGVVSAAMNVIGGIGGPAVALYAVHAGWPPRQARATLQAYFLALNIVALAALGLPDLHPLTLVALVAGWAAGVHADRRVPERAARTATLLVAATGGIVALVSAFSR